MPFLFVGSPTYSALNQPRQGTNSSEFTQLPYAYLCPVLVDLSLWY